MDLSQRTLLKKTTLVALAAFASTSTFANDELDPASHIGPPSVSVVDRMGVSLVSGTMSYSVTDVTIGGERGLTHTVSTAGGKMSVVRPNYRGFEDNFFGSIYGGRKSRNNNDLSDDIDILTVTDGTKTAVFRFEGSSGNWTIREHRGPNSDHARHKLTQPSKNEIIWTQDDGSKVTYHANDWLYPSAGIKAKMMSKEYPNGFTIHIDYKSEHTIGSVSTNTGYQLKYIFEGDTRPVTPAQQQWIDTTSLGEPYHYLSSIWSQSVPKHVVALNNAHQVCDLTAATCNYDTHWPKSTYEWPAGMPRVAYLPIPVNFTVRDAENRPTTFTMRGFDVAVPSSQFSSGYLFDREPGDESVSRITKVTPPSGKPLEYFYKNIVEASAIQTPMPSIVGYVRHSVLDRAKRGADELTYWLDINNGQGDTVEYRALGRKNMERLLFNQASEVIVDFRHWDMNVHYSNDLKSEIEIIYHKMKTGVEMFEYDDRSNVTGAIVKPTTYSLDELRTTASYSGCGTTNQKHCNKPSYIIDPNGNRTDYFYHNESGNVRSVILPPNKDGIRAKTIYTYDQYTANHSGPYKSPIWLLKEKYTCANVATCDGADKIVTEYEYEPANLHLVGEAVMADGQTLRTCYEYDRYGNQITVIPPKDNLNKTSCVN